MKIWLTIVLISLIALAPVEGQSQVVADSALTGSWEGSFTPGEMWKGGPALHKVTVRIQPLGDVYGGVLEIPAQGLFGELGIRLRRAGDSVVFSSRSGIRFAGRQIAADTIIGAWEQQGTAVSVVNLVRRSRSFERPPRPQEPVGQQPYTVHPFKVSSSLDGVEIAGLLTLPIGVGPFPAAVIIGGTGPQDRDGAAYGHKPFLVIADRLAKQGIAVLRLDERGVGASQGDLRTVTGGQIAIDVESALTKLRREPRVNPERVGLVGHSEGGLIAASIAARSSVAFVVLLASPGITAEEIVASQLAQNLKTAEITAEPSQIARIAREMVRAITSPDTALVATSLQSVLMEHRNVLGLTNAVQASAVTRRLNTPAQRWTLSQNPPALLAAVKAPVFALNGAKDALVDAQANLNAINRAVRSGGNQHVDVHELPQLGHMFAVSTSPYIFEYGLHEETFSEAVLKEIAVWIKALWQYEYGAARVGAPKARGT